MADYNCESFTGGIFRGRWRTSVVFNPLAFNRANLLSAYLRDPKKLKIYIHPVKGEIEIFQVRCLEAVILSIKGHLNLCPLMIFALLDETLIHQ